MDLFAFISHADPSKVRIGEKQIKEGQVSLLKSTMGHVVPPAGVNEQGNQNDDEILVDAGIVRIKDEVLDIVAEKAKGSMKKRKAVGGASGSNLPPKKLKADHDTSTGVTAVATLLYLISNPPIMTTTIATTVVAAASSVLVPRAGDEPTHASIFADSIYAGTIGPDIAGPSQPASTELSTNTFYVSRDMDSETLRQIYVPKWNVVNEFALDDPDTCLDAEVRMRTDHILREVKNLEVRCSRQAGLLKERDAEIESLKSQLSLKEAEATEEIRLCGQVATVEAAEATRVNELNGLKEQNSTLEKEKNALEHKVAAFEFADAAKVSLLEGTCFELCDEVSSYKLFMEPIKAVLDEQDKVLSNKVVRLDAELMGMALHLYEEFYPCFLTTIAGRRWIFGRGLRLEVIKCLQSLKYLAALGGAIGRAIDMGMKDGLAAGIDHGKAESGLVDVAGYDPFAKANYVSAVNALRAVDFPLLAQLAIRGDAASQCLSIFDAMVPLIESLSAENLVGEASTSGGPASVAATTSLSTTFVQARSVLPIPVFDYEVADMEAQAEASSSPKIIFEQETLKTSLKNPMT
nr:hypothetical protein [Tanacetum cinerariifolium]